MFVQIMMSNYTVWWSMFEIGQSVLCTQDWILNHIFGKLFATIMSCVSDVFFVLCTLWSFASYKLVSITLTHQLLAVFNCYVLIVISGWVKWFSHKPAYSCIIVSMVVGTHWKFAILRQIGRTAHCQKLPLLKKYEVRM